MIYAKHIIFAVLCTFFSLLETIMFPSRRHNNSKAVGSNVIASMWSTIYESKGHGLSRRSLSDDIDLSLQRVKLSHLPISFIQSYFPISPEYSFYGRLRKL